MIEAWSDPQLSNTSGADMYLVAGRGWQRGERTVTVNEGIRRHAEQSTETIRRGWQVAIAGGDQVEGALHRERKWGAGETRGLRK